MIIWAGEVAKLSGTTRATENEATTSQGTVGIRLDKESPSAHSVPPRKRLRFRMAAGVALGLASLLSIFLVLMARAIQLSTEAVYHERIIIAQTAAASVDDLLGHVLHQLEAVTHQVVWNTGHTIPSPEQPLIAQLMHVIGSFESIGIMNSEGRLLWSATTGPPEDMAALTAASAGLEAIQTRRSAISPAHYSTQHPPIAVTAVPLPDGRGNVVAALVGTLHLAHMGVELVPLPKGNDGAIRAQLVDGDGNVLASSEEGDLPAEANAHLDLLREALASGQPRAIVHDHPNGSPHVVAYAPFQRLPGGVFAEEPVDIALMVPRLLQRIGVFVGSTTLLLVSLGAWWYARRITRPLEELTGAAQAIAAGSFDVSVVAHSQDEVGMLARSFEQMRIHLKTAFEDRLRWESHLEQQVKERTEAVRQLLEKVISAQEDERNRVARELHDGPAQDLAALLVVMDALEPGLSVNVKEAALLNRVKIQARGALQEVRRLLLDLRPSALDDLGLAPAVRWYVETRLAGTQTDLSTTVLGHERRLHPILETALFRILQEAINNAAKHSQAHHIKVELDFSETVVTALVEDDGVGFDPAVYKSGSMGVGLGLLGMQERAALIGGTLEIRSQPGGGAQITVTVPIPEVINGANHVGNSR
ncbi:MAG: hypothetical protein HW403_485 [Dehalococcoidia bacterium]|nr:hypothetical protein [Dehalococcoidia bacterium]